MPKSTGEIAALLESAVREGKLLGSSSRNIQASLANEASAVALQSISELATAGQWSELNDRFYKTLTFGTGGLRGRTIGKIVTVAERGDAADGAPPQFPCAGTNAMNFENVARATRGLASYVREWMESRSAGERPKIVIAYDTRYFSKQFAELAARVATEEGCDAFVFDGARSTPELSFAVRHLAATAGVVVTASHNPPHDNGYKVYFSDGAQVVEPHAGGIIRKVDEDRNGTSEVAGGSGTIRKLGSEIDAAYSDKLKTLILDPDLVRSQSELRIVFTPIHGTGGVIIKPVLRELGFALEVVEEQDRFDGGFPTVKSPNPENAEALDLAIRQAQEHDCFLVVATDPDCDRVGVAVRSRDGKMRLLTGNQIGSLIAYYRAETLSRKGVLNRDNAANAVIIKTFVTTDLQKAIAQHYGIRCVETLTGFKYIGAKLGKYEAATGIAPLAYRELTEEESRNTRLKKSSYYIFGGEESYGYSGADFVRDKDGNGAAIMFCEVAAFAKSRGITIDQLLDEIYCRFGYFVERNGAITFEGAEGAEAIQRLLASYVSKPPDDIMGEAVVRLTNFETDQITDAEGDVIPKEKMLIFELADKTRIAVRGSGTEPKIKYYLFAQTAPPSANELAGLKSQTAARLEKIWEYLRTDAARRAQA